MNGQKKGRIVAAKIAVGLGVIPALMFAHKLGPDPRHTGAPGDTTCAISQCHVGTPLNGGGGNVVLTTSAGTSYTPGQQQTITITINDSKAKVYGFQLSARLDSSPVLGQAGDFTAGTQQIVLCDLGDLKVNGKPCPANESVEFIEHSFPFTKNTITVTWTAPATNVGTVTLYVAANAANGDNTELGDHIYTTQLTLCPVLGSSQALPAISSAQSAGGFNAKAGVSPGTWVEIFGKNFAAASCLWQGADFSGLNAPTSLGGVGVTIGGKSAYVDYVSTGQVNVQVPDGIPIGSGVPLVLSNSGGQSAPLTLQTFDTAPALLAPAQAPFMVNNKQYIVGQLSDQSFAGIPSHPAKAGDVMTIYGIGFGPVSPATPSGTIATGASSLPNVSFLFNQTPAQVLYAGLAPSFVGLYQFNIKVPAVSPGDYPLKVQVGSTAVSQTVFITVGQ